MPAKPDPAFEQRIGAVRHFSRFYTREIGLLQAGFLNSPFSLTQARVLYELSRRERCTASDLAAELGLDHGYLSRILAGFAKEKLISRERSKEDGRQIVLSLTAKGRKAFAPIDERSQRDAGALLEKLSLEDQQRVVNAMSTIEALVGHNEKQTRSYSLRPHRPGDMGWVVARHGVLYGEEYGWDAGIEALTAEIVSNFLKNFDPAREQCWIAEIDGEPVGSVFHREGAQEGRRGAIALADRRSESARARHRSPAGRGMHPFLARGRIQEDHAMDARGAQSRARDLSAARLHAHRGMGARRFRQARAAETWDLKL